MPFKRLLMIDDDEDDHFVVRHVVARYSAGIEVISAYDGEEALALLERDRPDAVVLDINMPGMNGFEFLDAYAKVHSAHAPVVAMLTNSVHDSDRQRALAFPFVKGFFRKPLTVANVGELARMLA